MSGWRLDGLRVFVRYSRGAEFSGTCVYKNPRIYVNLGRHLQYPYVMDTYLARAQSDARTWWKPSLSIELADAYQLVLFVFLHECYHLLVKRARRNTRQKESMCDRFAARHLVDRYAAPVRDAFGQQPPRAEWDFQHLDAFVAAAARRSHAPLQSAPLVCQPGQSSLFDLQHVKTD
ncbi:MAG: hypothetical protein ACE5GE_03820 [Phycisphaerae bacterium]